jgi:hypothetical protein
MMAWAPRIHLVIFHADIALLLYIGLELIGANQDEGHETKAQHD